MFLQYTFGKYRFGKKKDPRQSRRLVVSQVTVTPLKVLFVRLLGIVSGRWDVNLHLYCHLPISPVIAC